MRRAVCTWLQNKRRRGLATGEGQQRMQERRRIKRRKRSSDLLAFLFHLHAQELFYANAENTLSTHARKHFSQLSNAFIVGISFRRCGFLFCCQPSFWLLSLLIFLFSPDPFNYQLMVSSDDYSTRARLLFQRKHRPQWSPNCSHRHQDTLLSQASCTQLYMIVRREKRDMATLHTIV